jgi:hypothetical protein
VGGTSTDVSRFAGRYEIVYETTTGGVTMQAPQLGQPFSSFAFLPFPSFSVSFFGSCF